MSRSRRKSNERRAVCRYPVIAPDAMVGWWNNSTFVRIPARIIDVSTMGCWIETAQTPERGEKQTIWVCALGRSPAEWTEGTIVSLEKRFLGSYQIRIKFALHFPYESFKSLVYGAEGPEVGSDWEPPEYERDYYWR